MSRPVIASSARKHGVVDEDILHAYRNPIRRFELDDDLMMLVGASRAGGLLEVGVVVGDPDPVVVHAMKCREKFLAGLLDEVTSAENAAKRRNTGRR